MNSENFLNTSESAANIQKYCSVLCRDYPQVTNREAILEDLLQQDERENIKLTLKKSLLLPMANEINIKTFKIPNVQTYNCKLFQIDKNYIKIMAGPKPHSVILLEPREYIRTYYYVPVELIENLTANYLLNIEIHY